MRDAIASVSPRAEFEIRFGKPHEQIVEAARARRADVIVVGPHDDRHARSRWLGATAERIVRTSPIPVLVAVDPPARPPRTLLVPVNESRLTESILAWASRFAESFDAEVKLLHVWSESLYAYVASMAHAERQRRPRGATGRRAGDPRRHDALARGLDRGRFSRPPCGRDREARPGRGGHARHRRGDARRSHRDGQKRRARDRPISVRQHAANRAAPRAVFGVRCRRAARLGL